MASLDIPADSGRLLIMTAGWFGPYDSSHGVGGKMNVDDYFGKPKHPCLRDLQIGRWSTQQTNQTKCLSHHASLGEIKIDPSLLSINVYIKLVLGL